MNRQVTEHGDMGARYRARIHTCKSFWRKLPRWEYVIEREFVSWRYHRTSRKFHSKKQAVDAANQWLDAISKQPTDDSTFAGYVDRSTSDCCPHCGNIVEPDDVSGEPWCTECELKVEPMSATVHPEGGKHDS